MMTFRSLLVAGSLSGLALLAARPAAAECMEPCADFLCGDTSTTVLVGSRIARDTIRVDEIWGAPTTKVQLGDELGPFSELVLRAGERAYLAFGSTFGPMSSFPLVIDADGVVACPERPLPLADALAISLSSDCRGAATRAGVGDKPCNDVIEVGPGAGTCASGGSDSDAASIAFVVGLLALWTVRGRPEAA